MGSAQGQSESQAVSGDALGPDSPVLMALHGPSGCSGRSSAVGVGGVQYRA